MFVVCVYARRYSSQIALLVEIAVESKLHGSLSNEETAPARLLASVRLDFRDPYTQKWIDELESVLTERIEGLVRDAASAIRDAMDVFMASFESTTSNLRDLRDILEEQSIDFTSVELPPLPDSLEEDLTSEYRDQIQISALRRLRSSAWAAWGATAGFVSIEIALVHFSLEPVLGGTSTTASIVLYLLSLVSGGLLVALGHASFKGKSFALRCMAAVTLGFLAMTLSALRLVLFDTPFEADDPSFPPELVAVGIISTFGAIGNAAVTTALIEFARKRTDEARAYETDNALEISASRARVHARIARERHAAQGRDQRDQVRRTLTNGIPAEIRRIETVLRGDQAEARQVMRTEVLGARRKLDGEIKSAARQLARWRSEEQTR